MRQQLNEEVMEQVTGGTVVISKDKMKVGFTTLGEKYSLQNCQYRDAVSFIDELWESNRGLSDADFDQLAKKSLQAKGWI